MRVVSLACSNTEIVAALGMADHLVGVDSHSDYPVSVVERLPRVGPDLEIDVEAVAALEPDLVLASLTVPGHESVVEAVESAGLPLLTLAPERLDEVPRSIEEVAERLGVPERGEELAGRLRRALLDAPRPPPGPSLLIQWWPRPVIAPGGRSWVQGLLEAAGARNVLGDEDRLSRPLTDEEVAARSPDAIVLAWCGVAPEKYRPDVVYRNPAWADVPAVLNGRVFCVPEAHLGRPGPRLLDGLAELRQVVAATSRRGGD